MTFNLSKALMVLLVCLAFVGQAMASTVMSYQMMDMPMMSKMSASTNSAKMDHCIENMHNSMNTSTNINMGDNTDEISTHSTASAEESNERCCATTCNCFTGGCSGLVVLIKDINKQPIVNLSAKILFSPRLALSQQATSLYRPPILS